VLEGEAQGASGSEIAALIRSVGAVVLDEVPVDVRPNTYVLEMPDEASEDLSLREAADAAAVQRISVDFLWDSITSYEVLNPDEYTMEEEDDVATPELF